jgi:drug/metabolite transporter (DMT)-like permease
VCSACYVVVQKKFLAGYSAIQFTCWNIWLGTLLLLPIALWDLMTNITKVPWQPTLEIVYLGIFPGALAYLAFAYATQRLPAARVMSFLYLVAPLAILMAWPYLKELPSLLSLTGGAIAIAGVALVNTGQSKRTATPAIAVEEA